MIQKQTESKTEEQSQPIADDKKKVFLNISLFNYLL